MVSIDHNPASPPFLDEQEVEVQTFSQAVKYAFISDFSSTTGSPVLAFDLSKINL